MSVSGLFCPSSNDTVLLFGSSTVLTYNAEADLTTCCNGTHATVFLVCFQCDRQSWLCPVFFSSWHSKSGWPSMSAAAWTDTATSGVKMQNCPVPYVTAVGHGCQMLGNQGCFASHCRRKCRHVPRSAKKLCVQCKAGSSWMNVGFDAFQQGHLCKVT